MTNETLTNEEVNNAILATFYAPSFLTAQGLPEQAIRWSKAARRGEVKSLFESAQERPAKSKFRSPSIDDDRDEMQINDPSFADDEIRHAWGFNTQIDNLEILENDVSRLGEMIEDDPLTVIKWASENGYKSVIDEMGAYISKGLDFILNGETEQVDRKAKRKAETKAFVRFMCS